MNFMKKLAMVLTALALALGLSACGKSEGDGKIASQVTVSGTALALGAEFTAETQEKLGEPTNVVQAPSCHYDGSDSIYYYEGFTVYTYKEQEKSIIYSVELKDASLTTPEGAKTGMKLDEVKALYGDGYEEVTSGISYALGEGMKLNFRTADDAVTLIEYYKE